MAVPHKPNWKVNPGRKPFFGRILSPGERRVFIAGLAMGSAATAIVGVVGVSGFFAYLRQDAVKYDRAARPFLDAVMHRDYEHAWRLTAPELRRMSPRAEFERMCNQVLDTWGEIEQVKFQTANATVNENGVYATAAYQVRGKLRDGGATVTLVRAATGWQVVGFHGTWAPGPEKVHAPARGTT